MLTPYPFQSTVIESVMTGFKEFDKQLIVCPTGSGKTIMFSHIAARFQPKRTLILANRDELIDQAIDKLRAATGIFAQKEKAEFEASLSAPVVVASVQTMIRRLDKWPSDHFGLVIADEAQFSISESWQTVLRHFQGKVLGCTATPNRGDERNLGCYYENIATEIPLFDLINQGYLSRITIKSIPIKIDLSKVRQTAGDYNEDDLDDVLTPYLPEIARSVVEHAGFRRTLAFLPLIVTSKNFVEECCKVGLHAMHVDGTSKDRDEVRKRFASGELDLVGNSMVWSYGFDDPGIDCILWLRPTRSSALFAQGVGRGTRIAQGKINLLLLDPLWQHTKHNLIRPANLIATTQEIADEITKKSEEQTEPGGQGELDLEVLSNEVQVQRESKLRELLAANSKKKARTIDAMEFCLSLHATDIAEWQDVMPWHVKPVSDGQSKFLDRMGIDVDSIRSRGHASAIINLLISRSKLNLASPKQMRCLARLGVPNPEQMPFKQASDILDKRFRKPQSKLQPELSNAN